MAGFTVAITVWEGRVSPVFDAAQTLLIAQVEGTCILGEQSFQIDPSRLQQLVQFLSSRGVSVIICGAISERPARVLESAGFELLPFVAGEYKEVLEAFTHDKPEWTDLRMPGCGKNVCCRGRIRRGREIRPLKGVPAKPDSTGCGAGNNAGGRKRSRR